jgi:hypothetical protein
MRFLGSRPDSRHRPRAERAGTGVDLANEEGAMRRRRGLPAVTSGEGEPAGRGIRWALVLAAAGCSGIIGGGEPDGPARAGAAGAHEPGRPGAPGAPASANPAATGIAGSAAAGGATEGAGAMPLRRLTRREYVNTLRDLLGEGVPPAPAFPREPFTETGFAVPAPVSALDAQLLMDAAEKLAAAALRDPAPPVPCTTADAACARRFIETFGKRAYRRPLAAEEIADLEGLYAKGRALGFDFLGGVGLVLQAMLQAPGFLYVGTPGSERPAREGPLVKLTPHQTASRLSYFLWGSMPDGALFSAADAGKLAAPAEVLAQARRMLGERARARDTVRDFHLQWLRLEGLADVQKDRKTYPTWTAKLAAAMTDEVAAMAEHAALDGDGRLGTLLGATYSFVNADLARMYGVGASGSALVRTPLPPGQRKGVLTSLGFLSASSGADGSHPVSRGQVVYRQILCGELPAQPAEVPEPPPPAPDLSTRARFAGHAENPCAGCHKLFDDLGFAFEHYDGIGRYRTTDGGKPVDAAGRAPLPGGGHIVFENALELVDRLAAAADVRACLARQWLRYALGRREEAADARSLEAVLRALGPDAGVLDPMLAIVQSKSFLYRAPAPGEAP